MHRYLERNLHLQIYNGNKRNKLTLGVVKIFQYLQPMKHVIPKKNLTLRHAISPRNSCMFVIIKVAAQKKTLYTQFIRPR